ncbi:hypothetical protein ACRARG_01540 [Pseudooceanicola sp. C21-150M6]|uniref:hypothetical protein n=1 Tax=Pseudooceanicola sp. C21-150M6 TaxID=3434355 RepID=UPI003D7FFB15
MPKLIRLYIISVLIGFGIAALFAALLIGLDVGGLRHLVTGSSSGYLAAFLLWFFNGIVFAGVQFAIAIMQMKEDPGPRGGLRLPLTPAPQRAVQPVRQKR